jgi:hypothetical protein
MAKGGGSSQRQTTTQEPWKPAQPYLTDIMSQGQTLSRQAPSYYGGPLTVGQTPSRNSGMGERNSFNNSVFGGSQAPQYSDLTSATQSSNLNGGTDIGSMSSRGVAVCDHALTSGFKPTTHQWHLNLSAPQATNVASQIGQYNFGTSLDRFNGKAPRLALRAVSTRAAPTSRCSTASPTTPVCKGPSIRPMRQSCGISARRSCRAQPARHLHEQ